MWGEVEIYKGKTLLYKESNMLVDGAGELLADIMTVSPSLSAIAVANSDVATSAMLDTSNYTIQAISFGTSRQALQGNAHYMDTSTNPITGNQDPAYKWRAMWNASTSSTRTALTRSGPAALVYMPEAGLVPNIKGLENVSSYTPEVGMPTYPDPTLSFLEVDGSVSASMPIMIASSFDPGNFGYTWAPSAAEPLSSVCPGTGQLMNCMPSAIASGVFRHTIFSGAIGIGTNIPFGVSSNAGIIAGSLIGAFPDGSSVPVVDKNNAIHGSKAYFFSSLDYANLAAAVYEAHYSGVFNEASSMDASGFVTMVMSGTPRTATAPGGGYVYEMSSTLSGLCISGSNNVSSDGVVEYSLTIGSGDLGMANCYGGIYHLGLWSIDMNKSLRAGNSPPFSFDRLDNPRKYRLFARKGLSKNLCFINDYPGGSRHAGQGWDNYTDLIIKWRLHFL